MTSALAPSAPAAATSGGPRRRPAPPARTPAHPPHQIAAQHLLLLYGLLAALALALALARLASGPWFHVYNPRELGLIDGWPVSWESTYYTDHLPTFASDARPSFGISPVHYRTLLPLFLAAQLYAWSGAAFWSFAAIDLLFWGLAGIAGLHLALRLGATPLAAALAGFLTVASPVLASHMWRHDLHVADFAGLPIALWAAVVLVDEPRPPLQLSGALAVLLLLLSLSYQYQWLVAPLAYVLCATQPRIGWRRGALVMLGAVALYAVLTAASQALFRVAVGDPTTWTGAVVAPSRAILGPLGAARTPAQAYSAVAALLPDLEQLGAVWRAYHPLVLGAGLGGAFLLGRRMLLLLGDRHAHRSRRPPGLPCTLDGGPLLSPGRRRGRRCLRRRRGRRRARPAPLALGRRRGRAGPGPGVRRRDQPRSGRPPRLRPGLVALLHPHVQPLLGWPGAVDWAG